MRFLPDQSQERMTMPDPELSDPRTARDDDEDATNRGVSAEQPAEGSDDDVAEGSPGG